MLLTLEHHCSPLATDAMISSSFKKSQMRGFEVGEAKLCLGLAATPSLNQW